MGAARRSIVGSRGRESTDGSAGAVAMGAVAALAPTLWR